VPLRFAREEATREYRVGRELMRCPVLAQESNDFNVHKRDFAQLHEYANAVIVHLSLYVADIGRLNSTTELQGSGVSVRLLCSTHHRLLDSKTCVPAVSGCA
jgi:hypothetical protein